MAQRLGRAAHPGRKWVLSVPADGTGLIAGGPCSARCPAASAVSGSAAVGFRCPRPAGELGAAPRRVLKWIHTEF